MHLHWRVRRLPLGLTGILTTCVKRRLMVIVQFRRRVLLRTLNYIGGWLHWLDLCAATWIGLKRRARAAAEKLSPPPQKKVEKETPLQPFCHPPHTLRSVLDKVFQTKEEERRREGCGRTGRDGSAREKRGGGKTLRLTRSSPAVFKFISAAACMDACAVGWELTRARRGARA